jgi:hypothetical protein
MVRGDYLFAALLAGFFLYLVIHMMMNWPGNHLFRH